MKYHYLFLPVVVLITNSLILYSLTLSRSYAHMSIVPCKNLEAKKPDFFFFWCNILSFRNCHRRALKRDVTGNIIEKLSFMSLIF